MANPKPVAVDEGTAPAAEGIEGGAEKKKAPARVQGPRPAYILLNKPFPEDIEIVGSTRKAEEALEAIDSGEAEAYLRIMVK